jgi:DNA-directed RNA polymerase subunit L
MNQINNEQNNQFVDYDTQREYATKGQLRIELQEEQENDILVEQLEKTEFTAEEIQTALNNLNKNVKFVSVVEAAAEIKGVSA